MVHKNICKGGVLFAIWQGETQIILIEYTNKNKNNST